MANIDDIESSPIAQKLTPEQIKNWRNVLTGSLGSYALIMPDAEVQAARDKIQSGIPNMPE